jgi:hypothetical protein
MGQGVIDSFSQQLVKRGLFFYCLTQHAENTMLARQIVIITWKRVEPK